MVKKIILIMILALSLFIASCGESEETPKEVVKEEKKENNNGLINDITEDIKQYNFNSDLNEYETLWLKTLEEENPNTRIYHIKTKDINCEGCYEVYYKKDRTIEKIKTVNGNTQRTTIVDDLRVEIENSNVCDLFQGTWNECPSICETDEEACATVCGNPVCEFEEDKIITNDLGEVCGGIGVGDCKFGLTCYYENRTSDKTGICIEK